MNQKSLLIPRIDTLDTLPLDSVLTTLEEQGTRTTVDSLNWAASYPYHPLTLVTAAHSETALYIDFFVRCNFLRAENYESNSPVWEDSCVSLYAGASANAPFLSLSANCIGTVNAAYVIPGGVRKPLAKSDISLIQRMASCGPKPFREVEGLFAWNVLLRVPFPLIGINYLHGPTLLKGNFGKCASATSQPHFLTWNPVSTEEPTLECPEFAGDIILQ